MSKIMPALFIGHGSPMNAIEDNTYTQALASLGRELPQPAAILVVSAHWQTEGTRVSCSPTPKTIYDFYGFPRELYQITYPCPGSPEVAGRVRELLAPDTDCNDSWGIDHAAWAVLRHIYPTADIPVVELSLDVRKTPAQHYALAKKLAPLREEGVLILGSGNIVHNLRLADFHNLKATPPEWAIAFDQAVKERLEAGDHAALIDYGSLPSARLAVPTDEHYLPLLYAAALQRPDEPIRFCHEEIQNASVSMRCVQFG